MVRFRSTKAQAEHAVSRKIALGLKRHSHQGDGRIHSVGTARGYQQALKGFAVSAILAPQPQQKASSTLQIEPGWLPRKPSILIGKPFKFIWAFSWKL